jgi:hypothetical protein
VAELAEHDVEGCVPVRERLDVALPKLDLRTRDARVLLRPLEQLRGQVEPANAPARPRGRDRDDARSTGDVQDVLPGPNAGVLDQARRRRSRHHLEGCEVLPPLPLRFLEFRDRVVAHAFTSSVPW